jgi:outer membrane protein
MKRLMIILLTVLLIVPVTAQKRLTLNEAITIALQKNTMLTKMKNSISVSESQYKSAIGDFLPSLGARAGWNWQKVDDIGGTQRDFFGNDVDIPASSVDSRSYSLGIGGGVTLFNGLSNIASLYQKKDLLGAAEYSISKMKQDIVYRTTDLYFMVLNAEDLLKVREENVKYFKKLYETISERNQLGSVPLADVYTAQVQLGNAELLLIQAQNTAETLKSQLLGYLALNVLEDYSLVDPIKSDTSVDTNAYINDFESMDLMVKAALDKRLDYKSKLSEMNAAENAITMAKSGLFPTLSLDYSYSTGASKVTNLFDRKVLNIGMTFSVPIFSNFNTEAAIQSSQINFMNVKEDVQELERQIKIEVKQTYLDLTAAKKSLDVAIKNVTAAQENQKINQERYNLGSATILEVLQANRDNIDAQRNQINASFEFYRQYYKLNNALGRLEFSKYE